MQETSRLILTERQIDNAQPTPESARPIQELNNSINPDIKIDLLKIESDYEEVVRKSNRNSFISENKSSKNSQTSLNSNELTQNDDDNDLKIS